MPKPLAQAWIITRLNSWNTSNMVLHYVSRPNEDDFVARRKMKIDRRSFEIIPSFGIVRRDQAFGCMTRLRRHYFLISRTVLFWFSFTVTCDTRLTSRLMLLEK